MQGEHAKEQGGLLSFSALACRHVLKISPCILKKKKKQKKKPDACYEIWGGNPEVMPFKPHKIMHSTTVS